MKKVISLALFGSSKDYFRFFRGFIRAHLNLYPIEDGWVLKLHVDDAAFSAHRHVLNKLCEAGLIELTIICEPVILCRAMLWRMVPVFTPDVDYVFCRDLDALPMPRERHACEEFIESGLEAHTIHDAPVHGGFMGGLCGFYAPAFRMATGWRSIDDLYAAAGNIDWAYKGADQVALNHTLGPNGKVGILEHGYSGWSHGVASTSPRPARIFTNRVTRRVIAPDVGYPRWSSEVTAAADALAPHMGAAGYDVENAVRFYEEHGSIAVKAMLRACGG